MLFAHRAQKCRSNSIFARTKIRFHVTKLEFRRRMKTRRLSAVIWLRQQIVAPENLRNCVFCSPSARRLSSGRTERIRVPASSAKLINHRRLLIRIKIVSIQVSILSSVGSSAFCSTNASQISLKNSRLRLTLSWERNSASEEICLPRVSRVNCTVNCVVSIGVVIYR